MFHVSAPLRSHHSSRRYAEHYRRKRDIDYVSSAKERELETLALTAQENNRNFLVEAGMDGRNNILMEALGVTVDPYFILGEALRKA